MKKKEIFLISSLLVILILGFTPIFVKGGEESSNTSVPTIYAGTSFPGKVYKYTGGTSWEEISGSLGNAVLCLVEYEGYLYAGTMSNYPSSGIGRVWRYDGDMTWTLVGDNLDDQVCTLVVYKSNLYAGTAWGRGKLWKYNGPNNWDLVVNYKGSFYPGWSGFRAAYEWNELLCLGDIGYDIFGHYDGISFTHDQYSDGCCIYDYQEYQGYLYASAWQGRLHQSSDGTTWIGVLGYKDGNMWELEEFNDRLFMGYDYIGLWASTDVSLRGEQIWPTPDGITSMTTDNNFLYFGTGGEAGYNGQSTGTANIYQYDGINDPVLISEEDEFGAGVQVLYIPPRSIDKTLSATEGELGDTIHVTLKVNIPSGETVTIIDNLPEGFGFIEGTFTIDETSATPSFKNGKLTHIITEAGTYVLEFDVKIDKANNWEDLNVCNEVIATWYFNEEIVDEKEDSVCFTIHPFEDFSKGIWVCNGFADLTGIDIAYDLSHGERDYGAMNIIRSELTSRGATITQIFLGPITSSLLADYDILWIDDWGRGWWTPDELNIIYEWVLSGGSILFHANEIYSATDVSQMFGMNQGSGGYNSGPSNNIVDHWITTCMDEVYVPGRMSALIVSDPAYTIVYDAYDVPLTACAEVGAGRVVFIGDDLLYDFAIVSSDNDILANRAFDWLANKDSAPLNIEVETEVEWAVEIKVTNSFDYMMENVLITDRFGAEIEIDELFPSMITHGTVSYATKGKSEKVFLTWDVGDLLPGETARLIFLVSTDLNPAGKQEYTSPGDYELNSGSTLKFKDFEDIQLSAVTNSIYVTVLPLENP
ncbi:MAG: hypothetical protein ACFFBC_10710 [Promethearchaeota archaeon]